MRINKENIKEFIKWIYILSLICLFLKTFYFKFFWNIDDSVFLIPSIVLWLCYSFYGILKISVHQIYEIILLAAIIFLQVISNDGVGIVGQFSLFVAISCLIMTPMSFKKELLDAIIVVYTFICVISLAGWIAVYVLKIGIPYTYITYQEYTFFDYGIFNVRVEGIDFTRYLGMFLEPGYTGIMAILLMVANGFDFKKKLNVLLLICALATFSLATYILLFVYLIIKMRSLKFFLKSIMGIIGIIILLLIIHLTIYDLSWVFDYFIKRRLNSIFAGNITGNRFSDAFNVFFKEKILGNLYNMLLGYGSVSYLEQAKLYGFQSAGYKVYIAEFGCVNTILVFIFYMKEIIRKFNYESVSLYMLWVISFIDIAYPTWGCFLIYVVCVGASMNYLDKQGETYA